MHSEIYDGLRPDVAEALKTSAARIHSAIRRSRAEIGAELLAAKALVDHRKFAAWVDAEFGFTLRTAENFMAAARLVAEDEKFSRLQPSGQYLLAPGKAPESARTEIAERIASGVVPTRREVVRIVASHQQREGASPIKLNRFADAHVEPRPQVSLSAIAETLNDTIRRRNEAAASVRAALIEYLPAKVLTDVIQALRVTDVSAFMELATRLERESRHRRAGPHEAR